MSTSTQTRPLFSEVEAQLKKLAETDASQARRRWFQQQHKESGPDACWALKGNLLGARKKVL